MLWTRKVERAWLEVLLRRSDAPAMESVVTANPAHYHLGCNPFPAAEFDAPLEVVNYLEDGHGLPRTLQELDIVVLARIYKPNFCERYGAKPGEVVTTAYLLLSHRSAHAKSADIETCVHVNDRLFASELNHQFKSFST